MKFSDIRDLSKDDVLAAIGLETKTSTTSRLFGTVGLFSVGLLVGAGVALLLAPKTGQDLREDLGQRLRGLRDTASNLRGDLAEGGNNAVSSVSESQSDARI